MILFDAVYDAIIEVLIKEKSLNIQDIHKKIEEKILVSLPNFYKIIAKLIADQILIKENKKISIHKRWILAISNLSERMNGISAYYIDGEIIKLKDGKFLEYFWGSILEIDSLWWSLMMMVNNYYGKNIDTFVYQAHPYYMLWTKETEIGFFEQEMKLSTIHFLIWNTSVLDMYGIKFYENIGLKIQATENVPFPREGYCITIIGDYIFEFIYPENSIQYFWLLFDTTTSLELYNPELFRRIFEIRVRCKLTVRRNKRYADEVRTKFLACR